MMSGDLEDGEIEDGEIPEDGGGGGGGGHGEIVQASAVEKPQVQLAPPIVSTTKSSDIKAKSVSVTPKVKRTGAVTSKKHNEGSKSGPVEDDWAVSVEKAIEAALGNKGGDDCSDINIQHRKRRKRQFQDGDDQAEFKKSRLSHPSEGTEVGQVASSGQDEDEDEDDDEMLFVRGASPTMHGGYSSPSHGFHNESFPEGGPFDDTYESDFEQVEEEYIRPRRGGRGAKRLSTGRGGRGLMKKNVRGGLKKTMGGIEKRMGNKRPQRGKPMQGPQGGPDSICSFFMQGKCQKENECPFSHNALPPRKMELCKFYLMGCCAKKDKCLYMHSDFPCKFFHSGLKCGAGGRCKFSHGPLTEPLKEILLKHIETAPKEILGDFPRERAASIIYNKNCGNQGGSWPGVKKIPSLLEIEIPIPPQLLAGNPELRRDEEKSSMRRPGPMGTSDTEDMDGNMMTKNMSPNHENRNMAGRTGPRQWDADDGARPGDSGDEEVRHKGFHKMFRGRLGPNRELSEEREVQKRPNYQDQDFTEQLEQLKMLFRKESSADEGEGNVEKEKHRKHHRHSKKKKKRDSEAKALLKLQKLANKNASKEETVEKVEVPDMQEQDKASDGEAGDATDEEGKLEIDDRHEEEIMEQEQEQQEQEQEQEQEQDGGDSLTPATDYMEQIDISALNANEEDEETISSETKKEQLLETDNNSSSCSLELSGFPHNLPKKQRELFLRIQQQQREADSLSSQNQAGEIDEKEEEDEEPQDESWYSSDEEETSLTDVLKKLSKQEVEQKPEQEVRHPSPSRTPPLPPPVSTSAKALEGIKLSEISISEPISKLLSIIQQNISIPSKAQPQTPTETQHSTETQRSKESAIPIRDPRLLSSEMDTKATSSPPRRDPRTKPSNERRTSIYSSLPTPSTTSISSDSGNSLSADSYISQKQINPALEPGTNYGELRTRITTPLLQYAGSDLELGDDMDLKGPLGLPFKPVPMHKPAKEIDASLTSHPPIPYKVVPITIPWPDYSNLKLNVSDAQIRSDPRLRKLFKVSGTSSTKKQEGSSPPSTPSSPPHSSQVPKQSPSIIARNDPRRRNAPLSPHSTMSPRTQDPAYTETGTQNQMGMPQNPMGMSQNPMGMQQNRMGMPQNPMGIQQNPMGMQQNLMGMPQNPMGMPQNPMGVPQNRLGMMRNPMGMMQNQGMPPRMVPPMGPGMSFDPRLPRNPRNAPGLLGPAPLPMNFCPNTPQYEDMDESCGPNQDPRMFYNHNMQPQQGKNQGLSRSRNWKNNRKNHHNRYRGSRQQERSFTPPL